MKESLDELRLKEEYQSIILYTRGYVEHILNFLPISIHDFTDHGMLHSNNLLKLFVRFARNIRGFSFSQEEKLLICLAIYVHDVGCIIGRSEHNKKSAKLIMKHSSISNLQSQIGSDLLNCLKCVTLSHSGTYDLQKIQKEPIHDEVNLRVICAVFRLLDECEISSARVSKPLYDILTSYSKIKSEHRKYWDAHISIISLVFRGKKIIIDSDNLGKTRLLSNHLKKNLQQINRIFQEEHLPQLTVELVRQKF